MEVEYSGSIPLDAVRLYISGAHPMAVDAFTASGSHQRGWLYRGQLQVSGIVFETEMTVVGTADPNTIELKLQTAEEVDLDALQAAMSPLGFYEGRSNALTDRGQEAMFRRATAGMDLE